MLTTCRFGGGDHDQTTDDQATSATSSSCGPRTMPPPKSITLPVWAGYRKGPQAKPSTGKVKIQLHHGVRVTERVHTAIAAAKARSKSMQVILLDAIVVAYPTFRQWHERAPTTT